jgi:hypothetical protein
MAAAAASLLGLGAATVGPPPSAPPATPGAAAAFELLRPLAKTAPAAPGSGESRDDRLLENFLATLGRFEDVGEVKIGGKPWNVIGFAQIWGNLGCEKMSWDVLLLPQAMARIGKKNLGCGWTFGAHEILMKLWATRLARLKEG